MSRSRTYELYFVSGNVTRFTIHDIPDNKEASFLETYIPGNNDFTAHFPLMGTVINFKYVERIEIIE